MRLSKPDILQAAMVGLTLLLSAIAVPVIAFEQSYHLDSGQTAHNPQQPALLNQMQALN